MEDQDEIINYTQRVFENQDELYSKIIDLYISLLSIETIDVVDKVTNIKQDIENLVYDDDISEKPNVYVYSLKVRLMEVYHMFGVSVDENSDLETYTLIPKLISDIEKMDIEQLYFMEDIYSSDLDTEERFIRMLDILYGEGNIKYLEFIDVSTYLMDSVLYPIYLNKDAVGKPVNTTLFNSVARLILVNKAVVETVIAKDVMNGDFDIELSLKDDLEIILDLLVTNIRNLKALETTDELMILEIYTTLKLFECDESSLYTVSSDSLKTLYNMFSNGDEIKNKLTLMMR